MNKKTYQVAGHRFAVIGDKLSDITSNIAGFKPFEVADGDTLFTFEEASATTTPEMKHLQYSFTYEDVIGSFGQTDCGYMLMLTPKDTAPLHLWTCNGESVVKLQGNLATYLCRFAMWIGYGIMTLPYNTVAIHSSCIVYHDKAVLFLGESGTGKSTHTRLWREHIADSFLLNDDSPIIRIEDGKVWAYGSPWSGKTPCYKAERHELKSCVRLSQAPYNQIKKLSVLQAYGAIHPSCPPEFAYDDILYDCIGEFINKLLSAVPFYHLSCLPDKEAALLSCNTIFTD